MTDAFTEHDAAEEADRILRGECCRTCRHVAVSGLMSDDAPPRRIYQLRCTEGDAEERLGFVPRCPQSLWCPRWEGPSGR